MIFLIKIYSIILKWSFCDCPIVLFEKEKALIKIASQVAHDIRSPLAALQMLLREIHSHVPEAQRIALRSSVKRIQDIANNLSNMKDESDAEKIYEARRNNMRFELIGSLTETIISEKRTHYRDRENITIEEQFDESSYGAFAYVEATEYKRIISNLVNNAVEALGKQGTITASIHATENEVIIRIKDTGIGIPEDHIAKVFERGVSFGKKDGKGLGLAHARETIEKWNGSIHIESEVGIGTTLTITLKRVSSPAWFLPKIVVKPRTQIVILDDDQSIHEIWKMRFLEEELTKADSSLIHFSSAKNFCEWYEKQRFPRFLILSDYELLGEKESGLDVIKKYYIGHRSILVTSHCEDEVIQKRCEALGVRLLPKGLAHAVPIEIKTHEVYDALFIGKNLMQQMHWKLSAQEHNKNIYSYDSVEAFVYHARFIDSHVPVYIEESFLEKKYLELLRQTLTQYGFTTVYIIAKAPSKASSLPWISGVIDSTPPWVSP